MFCIDAQLKRRGSHLHLYLERQSIWVLGFDRNKIELEKKGRTQQKYK